MHFESMAITSETLCSHELPLQLFLFFVQKIGISAVGILGSYPNDRISNSIPAYLWHGYILVVEPLVFFVIVSFCHK